jgi:hypothetical protein
MKGEPDAKEPDDADGDAVAESVGEFPDIEDILDSTGKVLNEQPMWDKSIKAEIVRHQGDKLQRGKVKTMARPLGHNCDIPNMHCIVYEVEFPDGELRECAAKILEENMLSQVDQEDHNAMLIRVKFDYKWDEAKVVPIVDNPLTTRSGQRRLRKTPQS